MTLNRLRALSIRPKIRDFRSEIEWNGKNSGKSFRKFRNTFWVHPLWWNFRNYRKFCIPFARALGLATLQRNSSICFSGKIAGRPDELPVGIRPVCIISCVNNWHVSLVIRKWFSNSPDKYAGIVTSKYSFTRVNSLRIKQATAARIITSSLLSRMVQLILSQSPALKLIFVEWKAP